MDIGQLLGHSQLSEEWPEVYIRAIWVNTKWLLWGINEALWEGGDSNEGCHFIASLNSWTLDTGGWSFHLIMANQILTLFELFWVLFTCHIVHSKVVIGGLKKEQVIPKTQVSKTREKSQERSTWLTWHFDVCLQKDTKYNLKVGVTHKHVEVLIHKHWHPLQRIDNKHTSYADD